MFGLEISTSAGVANVIDITTPIFLETAATTHTFNDTTPTAYIAYPAGFRDGSASMDYFVILYMSDPNATDPNVEIFNGYGDFNVEMDDANNRVAITFIYGGSFGDVAFNLTLYFAAKSL